MPYLISLDYCPSVYTYGWSAVGQLWWNKYYYFPGTVKWSILLHYLNRVCLSYLSPYHLDKGQKTDHYLFLLLQELIKFVMMHEGSKHINAVDSIVANAIATGPDIHSLSAKDREDLSCLYLEVRISFEEILHSPYLLSWSLGRTLLLVYFFLLFFPFHIAISVHWIQFQPSF